MHWLLWTIILTYGVNFLVAPMPYWGGYFLIWYHICFDFKQKRIKPKHRVTMATKLIKAFLQMPFWTLCWYIDEFLYGKAISTEEVQKPIFMFNQPRNGSTFFHRTMANHENFYAVTHKEWRYPYVFVQKLIDASPFLQKIVFEDYWAGAGEAGERARALHNQTMNDYEEDGCFFEEHFFFHCFNGLWNPFPQLLWTMGQFHKLPYKVRRHTMVTHKRVIKKVQLLRRMKLSSDKRDMPLYFLSKENECWHRLPEYMDLYKDARFICIVRPPSESVVSFCALLAASVTSKQGVPMETDSKDPNGFIQAFLRQKRVDAKLHVDLYKKTLKGKKGHPKIAFKLAVKNIQPTMEYILQELDIPMTEQFQDALNAIESKQGKKKIGGHKDQDRSLFTGEGYDEFAEFELEVRAEHQLMLDNYKKNNPW